MMWLFAILVLLAFGGVAAVAVGRGAPLADDLGDRPDLRLPAAGPITGADLRRVRFPLVLRGYRMSDVDALLDRLAEQVDAPAPVRPATPGPAPRPVEGPQP
ncbi:MAG: DivIVA domain-containing protein [Nocardioides sp.]|nr:DivIVA domain-containing protein [Nocardioides sp.]